MKQRVAKRIIGGLFLVFFCTSIASVAEEPSTGGAENEVMPDIEGLAEMTDSKSGAPTPKESSPVATQPKKGASGGTKVLDFEAEVIEGERKTPNLFLQLEAETPNLDTVLFQRENFNDFHLLEKARKPRYRTTRGKRP